jgi:hypothetical protein
MVGKHIIVHMAIKRRLGSAWSHGREESSTNSDRTLWQLNNMVASTSDSIILLQPLARTHHPLIFDDVVLYLGLFDASSLAHILGSESSAPVWSLPSSSSQGSVLYRLTYREKFWPMSHAVLLNRSGTIDHESTKALHAGIRGEFSLSSSLELMVVWWNRLPAIQKCQAGKVCDDEQSPFCSMYK